MSFEALDATMRRSVPTPACKLVLLCLAYHLNSRTSDCYPSQQLIAKETGLHISTVERAIRVLSELGIITRRKARRRNAHFKSNEYELNFGDADPSSAAGDLTRKQPRARRAKQEPITSTAKASEVIVRRKVRHERPARRKALPESWSPKPDDAAQAMVMLGSSDEVERSTREFRSHHLAKGKRMADWNAAYRLWNSRRQAFWEAERGRGPWLSRVERGNERLAAIERGHRAAMAALALDGENHPAAESFHGRFSEMFGSPVGEICSTNVTVSDLSADDYIVEAD